MVFNQISGTNGGEKNKINEANIFFISEFKKLDSLKRQRYGNKIMNIKDPYTVAKGAYWIFRFAEIQVNKFGIRLKYPANSS